MTPQASHKPFWCWLLQCWFVVQIPIIPVHQAGPSEVRGRRVETTTKLLWLVLVTTGYRAPRLPTSAVIGASMVEASALSHVRS